MSDCNVCIGSWDGDAALFWSVSVVGAARKEHRCCECQDIIQVGESYERVGGMWPQHEKPLTYRTCLPCRDIRDGLSCGEGFTYTDLWEGIDQVLPDITTGCLSKIKSAAGRQKLLDYWREWKLAGEET